MKNDWDTSLSEHLAAAKIGQPRLEVHSLCFGHRQSEAFARRKKIWGLMLRLQENQHRIAVPLCNSSQSHFCLVKLFEEARKRCFAVGINFPNCRRVFLWERYRLFIQVRCFQRTRSHPSKRSARRRATINTAGSPEHLLTASNDKTHNGWRCDGNCVL